jgi:hypothetical protein
MQPRRAATGRQPDNRGGLVAPESWTAGPSGQGPITDGADIDESVLDLEPDDAEGTTGGSQLHRIAHDRPRQPQPQDARSHSGEMPGNEATHAIYNDRSPKSGRNDLADTGPSVSNSGVGTRKRDNGPPRFSTQMQIQGKCHRPAVVPGPALPTYAP